MILRRVKVLEHERALVFKDGAFEGVLQPGVHWMLDPLLRLKVDVVSIRNGWLVHPDLEPMVQLGPARPRGARRGPQDPPAGDRLGGRPPRARAEAGRLRAVDGAARACGST